MNRRGFLATLTAALAGAAMDPERLIWVPGQVTTFDLGAGLKNTFINPEWVMAECLERLKVNLTFTRNIDRDYSAAFGDVLHVRLPKRYLVTGAA